MRTGSAVWRAIASWLAAARPLHRELPRGELDWRQLHAVSLSRRVRR